MAQKLTLRELSRFDGKEGRPAYVAVDGVVYDVSASRRWANGEHRLCDLGARSGRDLSDEIKLAPSFMRSNLAQMPVVGEVVTVTRRWDRALQVGLVALAVVLVAVPFIAMGLFGFRSDTARFTALRMAALETFTLLFIDIMIGAFRPLLTKVFRAKVTHRAHQWIGLVAFALAIAHGTLILLQGLKGYPRAAVWVGPANLTVLTVIIVTALDRRGLTSVWRWIHRLNYLLFAAALTHASYVGANVRTQEFLRIVFYVYMAAVVVGLGYRIYLLLRRERMAGVGARARG